VDLSALLSRIRRRRHAYRLCFLHADGSPNVAGRIVLEDLARFCRAHRSTAVYSPIAGRMDPYASAKADGRREVWLRIMEHLHLEDRHIVNLREPTSGEQ